VLIRVGTYGVVPALPNAVGTGLLREGRLDRGTGEWGITPSRNDKSYRDEAGRSRLPQVDDEVISRVVLLQGIGDTPVEVITHDLNMCGRAGRCRG
jgi:hypothetical protein